MIGIGKAIIKGAARRKEAMKISPQLDWSKIDPFNLTGYGLPEAYVAAFEQAELNLKGKQDD